MCFPGCGQGDKSEADPDTYGFKLIPFCGSVSITYLVNDTEEVTITCEAPNVIQREFFLVDKFCAKWNGDGICRFYRGNEPLLTVYKDETGGELRWPVEVVE